MNVQIDRPTKTLDQRYRSCLRLSLGEARFSSVVFGDALIRIDKFTDFPEWLESQNYPKDKKMLIFCTGGIRCEKGILELQRQGYDNVFQLEGGILKYIEEKPNDQFEGECFVFDHRVAVNQELQPSTQYKLCPHCGQPAAHSIECKRCDTPALICEDCEKMDWKKETCSKNCAYHLELHPDRKGAHQTLIFEVERPPRTLNTSSYHANHSQASQETLT